MVIALLVVGMFGMFFLGALYLQRILGYDPLEVGLAFLPSTIVMGTMSLRVSGPLVMRFGPKATLLASLVSIGLGLLLFSRTPVDATYVTAGDARDDLHRHRRRARLPVADDARDVGRHARATRGWPRASSTRACRSAAPSASPCWPRSRASAPTRLRADGDSIDAALNGGFHLAYLIGAALVAVAIVVAADRAALGQPGRGGRTVAERPADRRHPEPAYSDAR